MTDVKPPAFLRSVSSGQQIFGLKGPDQALVPTAPKPENLKAEDPRRQAQLEEALGFDTERAELRSESDAEFARAAGGLDLRMDEELFLESATQLWGLTRSFAKACFVAGDADKSERINRHEWLLMREAFVHRSALYASHPEVRTLHARAVLYSYDSDQDGKLSSSEILAWLMDLSRNDTHNRRLAESLLAVIGAKGDGQTVDAIVQAMAPGQALATELAAHELSNADVITGLWRAVTAPISRSDQ